MKKISLSNLNLFTIDFHILILSCLGRIRIFSFCIMTYVGWWHVREGLERYSIFPYRCIYIEYFLHWSSLSVYYLQGRLLLQMKLKSASSMRQLKTYCQAHIPKIASKLQSLLWKTGQIFKKSLAACERLNPL